MGVISVMHGSHLAYRTVPAIAAASFQVQDGHYATSNFYCSWISYVQTTLIDINTEMVREELQVAYLLGSFPLSALQQAEVQGWEMVLVQA